MTPQQSATNDGIAKAARGAGELWLGSAGDLLTIFALTNKKFGSEDVREFAYDMGLPKAGDERWWGPVFARAGSEKNKVIKRLSKLGKAKNSQAHLRPTNVWKSNVYGG